MVTSLFNVGEYCGTNRNVTTQISTDVHALYYFVFDSCQ